MYVCMCVYVCMYVVEFSNIYPVNSLTIAMQHTPLAARVTEADRIASSLRLSNIAAAVLVTWRKQVCGDLEEAGVW